LSAFFAVEKLLFHGLLWYYLTPEWDLGTGRQNAGKSQILVHLKTTKNRRSYSAPRNGITLRFCARKAEKYG